MKGKIYSNKEIKFNISLKIEAKKIISLTESAMNPQGHVLLSSSFTDTLSFYNNIKASLDQSNVLVNIIRFH